MSRGHGKIQRTLLASLEHGPATSRMLYEECWTDNRGVRRALDRLWDEDVIRQHTKKLEHGMPVWCLTGDERQFNPDRVLPFVNERVWKRIRELEAEGWRDDERLEGIFYRCWDQMTGVDSVIVRAMIHEEMTEEEARTFIEELPGQMLQEAEEAAERAEEMKRMNDIIDAPKRMAQHLRELGEEYNRPDLIESADRMDAERCEPVRYLDQDPPA